MTLLYVTYYFFYFLLHIYILSLLHRIFQFLQQAASTQSYKIKHYTTFSHYYWTLNIVDDGLAWFNYYVVGISDSDYVACLLTKWYYISNWIFSFNYCSCWVLHSNVIKNPKKIKEQAKKVFILRPNRRKYIKF